MSLKKSHLRCRVMAQSIVFFITLFCFSTTNGMTENLEGHGVRSTYLSASTHTWGQATEWRFIWDNAQRLRIGSATDARMDAQPLVTMTFTPQGLPNTVAVRLGSGQSIKTFAPPISNDMVLSQGHPVPFDQLTPSDQKTATLSFHHTVAGTQFTEQLTRSVEWVTAADAPVDATIAATALSTLPATQPLLRITLKKGTALVVEQWWRPGDSLWICEQTPLRRSWRLAQNSD